MPGCSQCQINLHNCHIWLVYPAIISIICEFEYHSVLQIAFFPSKKKIHAFHSSIHQFKEISIHEIRFFINLCEYQWLHLLVPDINKVKVIIVFLLPPTGLSFFKFLFVFIGFSIGLMTFGSSSSTST